jgi:periplasmic protein TonB
MAMSLSVSPEMKVAVGAAAAMACMKRAAPVIAVHAALLWLIAQSGAVPAPVAAPTPTVMLTFVTDAPAPAVRPAAPTPAPVKHHSTPSPALLPHPAALSPTAIHQDQTVAPAALVAPVADVPPLPAPAAPPATPPLITTGVAYVRAPQPVYPATAKRRGDEGEVLLRALINTDGHVDQVELQHSSGFASLDEAARQALLSAQFKPYLEQGRPRAAYVVVPIKFQLTL